ncbi:MAG: tRNA (adenine-N1)-methyltransferase [Candidatus Bathyarchaeia archaeon]
MNEEVHEGDYVLLYFDEKRKWLVKVLEGREFHTHKGIIKLSNLINHRFGERIESSLKVDFWILKPTLYDYIMHAERPTQIIYPKDIGLILVKLDISSGKKVIEAGTGSGALTMALANAVKPSGIVYTYEVEDRFIESAKRNLKKANLLDYVIIRKKSVKEGFIERNVDAIVMDISEPWEVVPKAFEALKNGCSLASFSPTINQVEKTVEALKKAGFIDLSTIECLVRELRVEPGKTRPFTRMIGHTGYLTFARKTIS